MPPFAASLADSSMGCACIVAAPFGATVSSSCTLFTLGIRLMRLTALTRVSSSGTVPFSVITPLSLVMNTELKASWPFGF